MKRNYKNEAIDIIYKSDLTSKDLIIEILKENPFTIVCAARKLRPETMTMIEKQIMAFFSGPAKTHRKIEAIKLYKELTGGGVKDAKEAVEAIMEKFAA